MQFSSDFRKLIRRRGFNIRFHDLRHSHASQLLKAGVPVKVVSERLGHATASITLDVYSHVLTGMQAEAVAKIDAALGKAIGESPISLSALVANTAPDHTNTGGPPVGKSYKLNESQIPERRSQSVYSDIIADFVAQGVDTVRVDIEGMKSATLRAGLRRALRSREDMKLAQGGEETFLVRQAQQ